ncbi:MAG TPA: succinylglutamate desuccinylase/aspartoacylase family protein [Cellvibrio sp.]|nr:succinylglutamate desuccinylase/aspartoacylase family protein [Cellvibrio sp.]
MSQIITVARIKKTDSYLISILASVAFALLYVATFAISAQAQSVQDSAPAAIKLGDVDLVINPLAQSSATASSSSKSSVAATESAEAFSSSVKSEAVDHPTSAESSSVDKVVSSTDVSNSDIESSSASSVAALSSMASSQTASVKADAGPPPLAVSKFILDTEVKPNSSVRLTWSSETAVGGFSEETPVLVVHGAMPGKTLCLTGAVHGDELNGIEMIRRVIFDIDPSKLSGTVIGVPVANIMGFRRNSRYLPDRRDWNRYFPGNTHGSSASRLAYSFFTKIIMHCDSLVDLHTGSFHRTNLPQLRADLSDENVARLAQNFGVIAVLNGRGDRNSLRAAAVKAGIPAVTLEAGEPMAMQSEVVEEGVTAINTLLAKTGMYGKQKRWNRIAPVYYRSAWVRANQSGILFSKATLGQRVKEDDVLGTVTDPITNARTTIKSPYTGRIIGMALDQVVLPGFAAYHIGIQTPEAILIEESQLNEGAPEEDEEDGDDSGVDSTDEMDEPETGVSKAQDRMADE